MLERMGLLIGVSLIGLGWRSVGRGKVFRELVVGVGVSIDRENRISGIDSMLKQIFFLYSFISACYS